MSAESSSPFDAHLLADWLRDHQPVVAVTGAGISTASGIPDYRDEHGQWKRKQPMTYQAFTTDDHARHRYWARSHAGWPFFGSRQPNAAHEALAVLEARGLIDGIITQNVDRLHQRAGGHNIVDLHGRLDVVVCLACHARYRRDWLKRQFAMLNPEWTAATGAIAPDGDADIDEADFDAFVVPDCPRCGGMLKPDVVYFGESVPSERRDRAMAMVAAADGVLVVGSSLMVWSGFRLIRAAHGRGASIAAINHGHTRADDLLDLKCDGDCSAVLQALMAAVPA